jgi:hypothetical protein
MSFFEDELITNYLMFVLAEGHLPTKHHEKYDDYPISLHPSSSIKPNTPFPLLFYHNNSGNDLLSSDPVCKKR